MKERQRRVLDLYVDGYIPGPQFANENDELNRQIATLEQQEEAGGQSIATQSSLLRRTLSRLLRTSWRCEILVISGTPQLNQM